jgi:hypothetical protein
MVFIEGWHISEGMQVRIKKIPANLFCCSTIHNSQAMETAQMPVQLMDGLRKCDI